MWSVLFMLRKILNFCCINAIQKGLINKLISLQYIEVEGISEESNKTQIIWGKEGTVTNYFQTKMNNVYLTDLTQV